MSRPLASPSPAAGLGEGSATAAASSGVTGLTGGEALRAAAQGMEDAAWREGTDPAGLLSAHALAKAAGASTNHVTAVPHDAHGIAVDTTLRLGRHFRTGTEFWMSPQAAHDLEAARGRVAA